MMPGKMNSRQLAQMMKRFGINVKNIDNVEKVLIPDRYERITCFDSAEVTVMEAQGQKTFQIIGEPIVEEQRRGNPRHSKRGYQINHGAKPGNQKQRCARLYRRRTVILLRLSSN